MTFRSSLRTPFRQATSGSTTLVPFPWDCSLDGRTFQFDERFFGAQGTFRRSSIELLKPQQASGSISEESLNPADGIRAKVDSWHHGAGQTFLDRPVSDPYRFRTSKGVDPWTRWKLQLLPDTDQKRVSANTNLALTPAGARLYVVDGQSLVYTTDITAGTPSFSTVSSTPAEAVNGVASDGFTVWTAHGASGIYATNTDITTASQIVTSTCSGVIGYVKGRLMVAVNNSIYNVTDLVGPAVLPTALLTHPNTSFRWVGFAEGRNNIYAAGYSGDKSLIYRSGIKSDGTGLDAPIPAGELPDGEIVRTVGSYLGVVLIGTDRGWWTASQDSNGDLTVNKVQDTDSPVHCFEGQGDFIWYGWSDFDSTSTGLGRADLRSDTKGADVVTPAYASDLMVTAQGDVLSVCTFQDVRVLAISGSGVWAEDTVKVASGTLDSGLITHNLPDDKVAVTLTLTHEPLDGTIDAALSANGASFSTLGSSDLDGATRKSLSAASTPGETFETRLTLHRDTDETDTGPVVTRVTLESNPAPGRGEVFRVALLLYDTVKVANDAQPRTFDVPDSYRFLLSLEASGAPFTYHDPLGAETVTLEDHDYIVDGFTEKRDGFVGTFIANLRKPRSRV